MAEIDTRPQIVDIFHYAGDTLNITIVALEGLSAGMEWEAHVKATRDSPTADATFVIVPNSTGATLTLPAAVTRDLAETSGVLLTGLALRSAVPMVVNPEAEAVVRYQGQWDVQISGVGGTDPVSTLAQGSFTLDMDVTVD